ncbi:unnamed protein product [Thlaspi arvense]|uniref:Uncharacterized protein n=1 Tax=Thlaspi arvense TaxID=13288 RepID=A0AAU9SRH1_THLAR|nr:unnamed protein product [Thlaspi arvense]
MKGLIENYKELEGYSITVNEAQSRDINDGGVGRHSNSDDGRYYSGGCSSAYRTTIVVDMGEA